VPEKKEEAKQEIERSTVARPHTHTVTVMAAHFGDLHNHSRASDGELTPTELVGWAERLGTRVLGLTDHDTLAGLAEARQAAMARSRGSSPVVEVVRGVEVSLRFCREFFVGTLHYLLYVPDTLLEDAAFVAEADAVLAHARGAALTRARIAAINEHFHPRLLETPLTLEEVAEVCDGGAQLTRRHFCLALLKRGLDKHTVSAVVGNASPAYIPSGMEMATLAPLLRAYPQLVRVLAHPAAGSHPGPSHYKEVLPPVETVERLLPEIDAQLGLDGIEVHYPGHTPDLVERLLGWRRERELLVTGSSDCHDRTARPLGSGGVSEELTRALQARLRR